MADKPTDDGLDRRYREVWMPAVPPPGFVDRVLAVTDAEGSAAARKRRSLFGRGAIVVAAVLAAAAVLLIGYRPRAREGEHLATTDRLSVPITERAAAVLEPRAHLRWRLADGRVTVEQDAGEVFYRVDRGAAFEVKTAAGSVLVKGTCFKVEVNAMSPITHNLIGAVSGIAIMALVVTVYEGMVEVHNERGETRLGPGDRGVAEPGEAPSVARPAGAARASNVPRLSDAMLAELGADTHATIAALEQKVAALSSELAETRRLELEGRPDKDGIPKNKVHDLTPEELAVLARRCEIRYDVPKFLSNARIELRGLGEAVNGISEAEVAQLNRHLHEIAPANQDRLRALYREGTGDHAGAATLAPKEMIRALFQRYPQELDRARQRLALERAGQPAPGPDPGGPSVVERLLRLIFAAGDEWERRAAQVLGAERTHELRRKGEGYEPGSIQSGCPNGKLIELRGGP
jgi:ferric-dicitrate binding protein FerR (iron transport regulator)